VGRIGAGTGRRRFVLSRTGKRYRLLAREKLFIFDFSFPSAFVYLLGIVLLQVQIGLAFLRTASLRSPKFSLSALVGEGASGLNDFREAIRATARQYTFHYLP